MPGTHLAGALFAGALRLVRGVRGDFLGSRANSYAAGGTDSMRSGNALSGNQNYHPRGSIEL